jgi:hypothetical protein
MNKRIFSQSCRQWAWISVQRAFHAWRDNTTAVQDFEVVILAKALDIAVEELLTKTRPFFLKCAIVITEGEHYEEIWNQP